MFEELRSRKVYYGTVGGVALLAGLALAIFVVRGGTGASGSSMPDRSYLRLGTGEARSGTEIVAVFIGSSQCPASNHPDLPETVKEAKRRLAEEADERGHAFASVGIAIDWSVSEGLDHLEDFGSFDEVSAGRNWMNLGAIQFIWKRLPGQAATPQMLVFERSVRGPEAANAGSRYEISDPELVVRKVGRSRIDAWVEQEALLSPLYDRTSVAETQESSSPASGASSVGSGQAP